MSKSKKAEKPLEVRIMFEANRLATEYQIEAYRQLVPLQDDVAKSKQVSESAESAKAKVEEAL